MAVLTQQQSTKQVLSDNKIFHLLNGFSFLVVSFLFWVVR